MVMEQLQEVVKKCSWWEEGKEHLGFYRVTGGNKILPDTTLRLQIVLLFREVVLKLWVMTTLVMELFLQWLASQIYSIPNTYSMIHNSSRVAIMR